MMIKAHPEDGKHAFLINPGDEPFRLRCWYCGVLAQGLDARADPKEASEPCPYLEEVEEEMLLIP